MRTKRAINSRRAQKFRNLAEAKANRVVIRPYSVTAGLTYVNKF